MAMIHINCSPPKKFLFPLLFGFMCLAGFSQRQNVPGEFWSKVRYGGGLGLGFGSNAFNLAVAPSAIYQANEYFAAGIGLSVNYAKFGGTKFTAYGGSLITLFNPIPVIQLSAELEQLRVNRTLELIPSGSLKDNYWSPALMLGAGYGNRNVTVGIRYDVLHDPDKSIYTDPWMPFVRVYF